MLMKHPASPRDSWLVHTGAALGKGGGGTPQSSQVIQTNLPEYAEPYYKEIMERSRVESQAPYTPYQGKRFAEMGPETFRGIDMLRNASAAEPGQIGYASNVAARAANLRPGTIQSMYGPSNIASNYRGAPVVSQYYAGPIQSSNVAHGYGGRSQFDPGQWSGYQADRYMNPYTSRVLDVAQQRAMERFGEQQLERDAQAVAAGAFGGNRRAVADQAAQRDLNRQLADIEAQGLESAYRSAGEMFQADRAASMQAQLAAEQSLSEADKRYLQAQMATQEGSLQAQMAYEAARQKAGEMGLRGQEASQQAFQEAGRQMLAGQQATDASIAAADQRAIQAQIAQEEARQRAAQIQLEAAQRLGGLGAMQQELALQRGQTQMGLGDYMRDYQQQMLDIGYTDFLNQRDYEKQQLGWYGGMMHGVPVTSSSNTTSYQAPPSPWSTLMGLGIGGYGLSRMMG